VARVLPVLFLIVLFAVLGVATTQDKVARPMQPSSEELAPEILNVIAGYSEQVRHGAEVYDLVCSNCHGNTGLGIEEGRAEFLPEHQNCEKCHRPNNAAKKVDVEISDRNSFNIGEPPALHELAKFGSAAGLKAYLQAAMPRYEPGRLSDEEYVDITAFLLVLNDKLPTDTTLTAENITTLLLAE
jgi:mono/diheme cytochrome c family protein